MGPVYRIPAFIKGLAFSNAGPKISRKILNTKLATGYVSNEATRPPPLQDILNSDDVI